MGKVESHSTATSGFRLMRTTGTVRRFEKDSDRSDQMTSTNASASCLRSVRSVGSRKPSAAPNLADEVGPIRTWKNEHTVKQ